jgi:hypothetical protein
LGYTLRGQQACPLFFELGGYLAGDLDAAGPRVPGAACQRVILQYGAWKYLLGVGVEQYVQADGDVEGQLAFSSLFLVPVLLLVDL